MTPTEPTPELVALLEPTEVVLWWGRPHYPYFRSEAWAAFVFGLITLGASSVAVLIAIMLIANAFATGTFKQIPALPIALIPAAVFGYIAAKALSTPWTAPRKLRRTLYVVTNQRVIVSNGIGYALSDMIPGTNQPLYSFTPQQARSRKIEKHRGGRVDLVLLREVQPGGKRSTVVDIGILGAKDWQAADAAMEQLAAGH